MAASALYLDDVEPATPSSVLDLPMQDPHFGPNRRFMPRVTSRFSVRLGDSIGRLDGVDISFGGLMCTSPEPVWPGNVLDMHVNLPGEDESIEARGRVVELVSYRGRVAMRVRFEGMSNARRKQIAGWMAKQAAERAAR
jgi:hypothetical protein